MHCLPRHQSVVKGQCVATRQGSLASRRRYCTPARRALRETRLSDDVHSDVMVTQGLRSRLVVLAGSKG